MTRQLALAGLFIILLQLFQPGLTTERENFMFVSKMHQEMCAPSNDSVGDSINSDNKCCGFCSNDPDCALYGICCLGMKESFEEATASAESTR